MTGETAQTAWRWERGENDVWTLWFDQTWRRHNLLDRQALDELDERLEEVERDGSAAGVLIRSAKSVGFCAGADLKLFRQAETAAEIESYARRGIEVLDRLANLKPPTTAVLHGVCLGGGFDLALACKHRAAVASDIPFQLGSPEIHFGIIPIWGALQLLPRILAPKDALDLLLLGNPIGFLQAKSQGVVDCLISQDESERLLGTLWYEPITERPFNKEIWNDEIEFARVKLTQHTLDFPDAPAAILDILQIDLDEGPEKAREAALAKLVELAMDQESRAAIADFFDRPRK